MSEKIIITKAKVNERILSLATEIAAEYIGKKVVLVCILKGSFIFTADLIRALWQQGLTDASVDFMGISSYGDNTESSKNPRITHDLTLDIHNRHVFIVEDIIDTGLSLDALQRFLAERTPASLKTIVLLSKSSRREIPVKLDYVGFEIDGWIEGYGLDSAELGRGRPEIIVKS